MNTDWQSIAAASVVTGTAVIFLVRMIRRRGAAGLPGCSGCSCAPAARKRL